ncbi:hypothetical protein BSLG_007320 [Batrachochytrium salamandrivorans]|nr:hypothetical protein BSLG_007320 [Batrachochytrium salamandrivorans]
MPLRGLSKEALRITFRRRAFVVLNRAVGWLSPCLYVVGLLLLLVLPLQLPAPWPRLHHSADIDEKALLVGQVNRYFHYADMDNSFHTGLGMQLWQPNITSLEHATLLQDQMENLGLDVSVQRFHYLLEDEVVVGYNVHGILRAPRGDGTEAMVLTAPMTLYDGSFNSNGVRYLFGLAKFLKKHSFWSKDIIILVTTKNAYGTYSWLQAYHGFKPDPSQDLVFDPLETHAGSIQSALCLEFPGTQDYTSIGIFPEGVNGLLPNADLVSTVILTITDPYHGVPLELHDGDNASSGDSIYENYLGCITRLWRFVLFQASCMPKAGHALFLQYKIEAITFRGLVVPGKLQSVGMMQVAQILENTLRSLNNLLEKFHHSYWFYFMPTARQFMPISIYIVPVVILASSLIVASIGQWWEEPLLVDKTGFSTMDRSENPIYIRRIKGVTSFSSFVRPLFLPLLTLTISFCASAWAMSISDTVAYISASSTESLLFVSATIIGLQVVLVYYVMPFFHRIAYGSGASTNSSLAAWKILKMLCCSALGMILLVLSAVNPSLSILVALPYVPVFLAIRPVSGKILRIVQGIILNILSPPGCLLLACFLVGDSQAVMQAVKEAIRNWHIFGSQLVPFFCLLIWPLNLSAQTIIEMEM